MAMEYEKSEPRESTLLQRLLDAGIGEERAADAILKGRVRVAGHDNPVTDPDASVPWPTAWEFLPS